LTHTDLPVVLRIYDQVNIKCSKDEHISMNESKAVLTEETAKHPIETEWKECISSEFGVPYWYDSKTQTSVWSKPMKNDKDIAAEDIWVSSYSEEPNS